jgi:hypothetical protein
VGTAAPSVAVSPSNVATAANVNGFSGRTPNRKEDIERPMTAAKTSPNAMPTPRILLDDAYDLAHGQWAAAGGHAANDKSPSQRRSSALFLDNNLRIL